MSATNRFFALFKPTIVFMLMLIPICLLLQIMYEQLFYTYIKEYRFGWYYARQWVFAMLLPHNINETLQLSFYIALPAAKLWLIAFHYESFKIKHLFKKLFKHDGIYLIIVSIALWFVPASLIVMEYFLIPFIWFMLFFCCYSVLSRDEKLVEHIPNENYKHRLSFGLDIIFIVYTIHILAKL